jgi:hypothetical protein
MNKRIILFSASLLLSLAFITLLDNFILWTLFPRSQYFDPSRPPTDRDPYFSYTIFNLYPYPSFIPSDSDSVARLYNLATPLFQFMLYVPLSYLAVILLNILAWLKPKT